MELSLKTLRYIRMVLWAFFGIRRRASAETEIDHLRAVPLLITATALAAAFVGLLIWVANAAVNGLG